MKKITTSLLLIFILQFNVFTIKAQLYWSETFSEYAVGQNIAKSVISGPGLTGTWSFQNDAAANTGYIIKNNTPMVFGSLLNDVNYFSGGYAYTGVGINFQVSGNNFATAYKCDAASDVAGYKSGGSNEFWFSMILRSDLGVSASIGFSSSATAWILGSTPMQARQNDNGSWDLMVDGTAYPTGITVAKGVISLLVCKFNFESNGTRLTMFVNPTLGTLPTGGVTAKTAVPQNFRSIPIYLSSGPNSVSIDELRIGATFADVTPRNSTADAVPPTIPTNLSSSGITNSSFMLSWTPSTDNDKVLYYEVFEGAIIKGRTSTTSMVIVGLTPQSLHTYTVKATDATLNVSDASQPFSVTTPGIGTSTDITVDKSVKHQTIDGFGFFGPMDAWWSSKDPNHFFNDSWLEEIISDLGITIWRNEIWPPAVTAVDPWSSSIDPAFWGQDNNWTTVKPVVQALKAKSDKYNVNLKFIATIWSPPAQWKIDDMTKHGTVHASGTKWGGMLDPFYYPDYANWLIQGVQDYKDAGINLYALSLQNEPYFYEPYNSCFHQPADYVTMIDNCVPPIKKVFPELKIFGSENMLEMEGADKNWPWFYQNSILKDANASGLMDILAVHGYSDGVAATSGSMLQTYWTNHKTQFSGKMHKQAWMTETSGYANSWESTTQPGALALASDILNGLLFGDMSGWVYWQGEGDLLIGNTLTKKGIASKNFYRYIRPGAVRVNASAVSPDILVGAFENTSLGTNTIVILNTAAEYKSINLKGITGNFEMFVSSDYDNCVSKGILSSSSDFVLPARSLVTLISGGTALSPAKVTEIKNVNLTNTLKLYPNPVNEHLIIDFGTTMDQGNLSLFDAQGRMVINKSIVNTQIENIDVRNLSRGIYFIEVLKGDQILKTRFVKK